MKKLFVAVLVSLFTIGACAQTTSADSCADKAVGKDRKPLYGAPRTVSVKKYEQDKAAGKIGKKPERNKTLPAMKNQERFFLFYYLTFCAR